MYRTQKVVLSMLLASLSVIVALQGIRIKGLEDKLVDVDVKVCKVVKQKVDKVGADIIYMECNK